MSVTREQAARAFATVSERALCFATGVMAANFDESYGFTKVLGQTIDSTTLSIPPLFGAPVSGEIVRREETILPFLQNVSLETIGVFVGQELAANNINLFELGRDAFTLAQNALR